MKPTHIIIHHSLSKDTGSLSWNAIRRFHAGKGWMDPAGSGEAVGYHLAVELATDAAGFSHYEMLMGRPFSSPGAHCKQEGMNRKSLGVCFVGDYDRTPPPEEMLHFAAWRLVALCAAYDIPIDRQHIRGHGELATHKTCPGKAFSVDSFVKRMQEIPDA